MGHNKEFLFVVGDSFLGYCLDREEGDGVRDSECNPDLHPSR